MVELKIAKARLQLNQDYIKLNKSIDIFENKPTKINRDEVNKNIMQLRTDLTDFKKYVSNLYLKM